MVDIATLMLDERGIVTAADPRVCLLLRGKADDLVGRDMLSITAPADRAKCAELFAQLVATGLPVATTKRLVRCDGTHVWVRTNVDRAPDDAGTRRFAARIEPSTPQAEWVEPERLLQLAPMVRASRRARAAVFEPGLFTDIAWDILIAAYIAEAKGRVLTIADIHAELGVSLANASRWIRALETEGLVEYEGAETTRLITAPVRLSAAGHQRFERYLTDFFVTLTAAAPAPVE